MGKVPTGLDTMIETATGDVLVFWYFNNQWWHVRLDPETGLAKGEVQHDG